MKKLIIVLSVVATLFSCDVQGRYNITGVCKGASDGDIVTLSYSNDGRHLREMARCEIKNETFQFTGFVKGCKICYIGDESLQSPQYVMFFLEEGDMHVTFSGTDGVVSGTRNNDLYNMATDSVEWYVDALATLEREIARSEVNSIARDSLSFIGYNTQCGLTNFVRNSVKGNIDNLFGLYMLVMYNRFFKPAEIKELIELVPETSIDRKNNALYDLIVEIQAYREKDEFLD